MFYKVSQVWGDHTLSLETGQMARHVNGSVVVRYGDSVLLCTIVIDKKDSRHLDFLPLSVHYQEKAFAMGRFPGGFVKREGKPSDRETLISRLIDRAIRVLFPSSFRREVQIIVTLLSYDPATDVEVAAIIGTSAAISLSGIDFHGSVAAARVGYSDEGQYVLNSVRPSHLDLIMAGTQEGVLMVESEAKELDEQIMLGALAFGHKALKPVLSMIDELKTKAGKPVWTSLEEWDENLEVSLKKFSKKRLEEAYNLERKQERRSCLELLHIDALEHFKDYDPNSVTECLHKLQAHVMRTKIVKEQQRIGGRKFDEVRPITSLINVLPRAHGSALFTRGETQTLTVVTLGSSSDEQVVEGPAGEFRENFILHYNFPPFCVGEVGRLSAPGRREIGHGNLAWRALAALVKEALKDFPYTIRVVSEVLESNGSSSMASVCGATLSLLDAGVPLKRSVAGIAMGLIKEGRKSIILSDISGDEDHLGDMDFKVAGTDQGITALQMDLKIAGISLKLMKEALEQAKIGRLHILSCMNHCISEPKETLSPYAPRIVHVKIDRDKIRDLIGPGGRKIREICEQTKTKIDIGEDGTLSVYGADSKLVDQALEIINQIGFHVAVGEIYTGTVVKIIEVGAFVQLPGGKDGMVHISELSSNHTEHVSDVLTVGQTIKVKVTHVDEKGKVRLSIKQIES